MAEHGATGASCEGTFQLQIIDVPAIDSVLFAAPKTSVIDIAQAVGRALRPHSDADTATIIVPALLSPGGDGSPEPADGGQWEPVLNVVRALAAHDEAKPSHSHPSPSLPFPAMGGQ